MQDEDNVTEFTFNMENPFASATRCGHLQVLTVICYKESHIKVHPQAVTFQVVGWAVQCTVMDPVSELPKDHNTSSTLTTYSHRCQFWINWQQKGLAPLEQLE